MKNENKESEHKFRYKTIRNVFFVYLFTSVISDKPKIFSSICASLPFIVPVFFSKSGTPSFSGITKSVIYGVPGMLVAVIYLLLTDSYATALWLLPGAYGLAFSIAYFAVHKNISANSRAAMKCIICIAVSFLAFI